MNATAISVENNVQAATAQIIPFRFETREVRTLVIDSDPWFVASDICKALGIANTTQALQALDDDERSMFNIGRQGKANIINESGLFTLILRSREATTPGTPQHRFRKWVTAEVLPAIRKHGRYEDTENRMATLVGQTIGTDGFHCLAAVVDGKVRHLPAPYRRGAKNHIWSQVHKAFSVVSVEDIPASQMDSVRNFIGAYALEGEWLPRERKAERLPIDWPAERLAELNPHVYGRFSSSDPSIGIPLKGLCGMDSKSPTLRLLGTLSRNGYEVDACRIEVLAMRHHLESYRDISMQMHGVWEHRDERSITFKTDETAKSLRTDGVRGF
uniref:BRO-N domain-containing protein n=1 Tax=Pseudomonas sp. RW407 TaxID=2202894 RepID=UPI001C43C999|nr:BRO family protein [Pseudomonas sp. RW407]